MSHPPPMQIYEFGDFRVDAQSRLLLCKGERVRLSAKAFDVLLVLLEERGRVVEKDELMRRVWPDAVVEENNLTVNMSALRKSLNEGPRDHRYLVTVPGRGYQFVAEVRQPSEEPRSEIKPQLPAPQATKSQPTKQIFLESRYMAPLVLAGVVVTIVVATYFGYSRSFGGNAKVRNDSIAVLPFANIGDDPDLEYLSDGISESLINSLSRVSDLRVMARTTVFRYKGRNADPQNVGRELGVSAVLTGKLQTRGDDLIIQADLVNVADGSQLWGEQYNRKLTQLVAVQNEIAHEVSRKLRAPLSDSDQQKLTKDYTANSEAYQLYLKGRYHLLKMVPSEIQKGISYFQQAIETDPSYALAYVGLATAYRTLTLAGEMPSAKFFPQAKVAVQKAIEIDDTLAEGHAESSLITSWYDWDWKEAEMQGRRALELNPNSADAHLALGRSLCVTGRDAEGLAEIRRARELDPLNLRINTVEGEFLIHAGQTDQALAGLQKTLELDPNFWFAHMFIASALIEKGRFTEAIAAARKARELSGGNTQSIAYGAFASAKSGKREEARAALEELLNSSTKHYIPPYNIAMIYNGLDEPAEALAWLERGYEQREPRMSLMKGEPKWNNLRSDPRFKDLMRRVGFEP